MVEPNSRGLATVSRDASTSPLAGRSVLVTRSAPAAAGLGRRLAALGAEAVIMPAIRIVPIEAIRLGPALEGLSGYDWLVFTSANAVHQLWNRLEGQSGDAARRLLTTDEGMPRVAVVGEATRRAAVERGIVVHRVPRRFTGADLVEAMAARPGQRVLLPRSRRGRPEIVEGLRAVGAEVEDISIYDTRRALPDSTVLDDLASRVSLDASIFTSPSAVRNTMAIVREAAPQHLPQHLPRLVRRSVVACIGPSTADAAEAEGLSVAVRPERFTIDDLLAALATHFEERR